MKKIVAISFTVFKTKILSGQKDQTIRKWNELRVHQMKTLRRLQLYWKQRTPECELLMEVDLRYINKIRIEADPLAIVMYFPKTKEWKRCPRELRDNIISRDGFETTREFIEFFKRYDLTKQDFSLIRWKALVSKSKNYSIMDFI